MTQEDIKLFESFTAPLIGKSLTHLWHGYGSAIFLEFGELTPRSRRDVTAGNPQGEITFSVEWSWRLEGKRLIWVGSWSEEERWSRILPKLLTGTVAAVSMFRHLGEVSVDFTNGLRFVSFMTREGDPDWALSNTERVYISVVSGHLKVDTRDANHFLGIADA